MAKSDEAVGRWNSDMMKGRHLEDYMKQTSFVAMAFSSDPVVVPETIVGKDMLASYGSS